MGGGTTFDPAGLTGAKFVFMLDPARTFRAFPTDPRPQPPALYSGTGDVGFWRQAVDLAINRFYPTATLTQQITNRDGLNSELAILAGGSDGNDPTPENTYESFSVAVSTSPGFLAVDPGHPVSNPQVPADRLLDGPHPTGAAPLPDEKLGEYPRLHLLSDGTIFHSGSEPLGAKVNLSDAHTTRQWDRTVGRTGTSWPFDRHDGSHVFFMHVNDLDNATIRMGGASVDYGASTATSTDTSEICFAGSADAGWKSLGAIPGGPRAFLNAVILPDAAIAVIGGGNRTAPQAGTPIRLTAVYKAATGWCQVAQSGDSPSIRGYHATAVLLVDGRVLIGGGEAGDASDSDYDIYEPHYLDGNPTRPTITAITDGNGGSLTVEDEDPQNPGTKLTTVLDLNPPTNQFQIVCGNVGQIDAITRVVLIAPGSMTHHSDMSAFYLELPSVASGNTTRLFALTRQISTPAGTRTSITPRGYYMLFALNSSNIPSVASWVRVN